MGHHNGGGFSCRLCPEKKLPPGLFAAKRHASSCGARPKAKSNPPAAAVKHWCSELGCGQHFTSVPLLKSHYRLEHPDCLKPFRCWSCRKKFSTWASKKRHMAEKHSDETPMFECDVCDFHSHRKYKVTSHMITQHGEKQPDGGSRDNIGIIQPGDGSRDNNGINQPGGGSRDDAGRKQPGGGSRDNAGRNQPGGGSRNNAGRNQPGGGSRDNAGRNQPGGGSRDSDGHEESGLVRQLRKTISFDLKIGDDSDFAKHRLESLREQLALALSRDDLHNKSQEDRRREQETVKEKRVEARKRRAEIALEVEPRKSARLGAEQKKNKSSDEVKEPARKESRWDKFMPSPYASSQEDDEFVCETCRKPFVCYTKLQRHIVSMHKAGETHFSCYRSFCNQSFTTKFEMLQHCQNCVKRCLVCGWTTVNKEKWACHVRKHLREH